SAPALGAACLHDALPILLSLLMQPRQDREELLRIAEASLYAAVRRPRVWRAYLGVLPGSPYEVRRKALEDMAALLLEKYAMRCVDRKDTSELQSRENLVC